MPLIASLLTLAALTTAGPQRWAPPGLTSDQYESSPAFTPDGREIYFMRSDTQFRQWRILHARCEDGRWTSPEPFTLAAPPALDADPFVSADGQRLYFVSSRQNADGGDQLDIWRARRGDAGWLAPERLPEPVNSSGSELLPRETADGRLYYGSDRPGGLGQGDIYIATPQADGSWQVTNAGPPLSTPAHEYEVDLSRDGRSAVVVANRGSRSHLYHYLLVDGRWQEQGQLRADDDQFQIGPLHSPAGDRLLFAQRDKTGSGEFFLLDLAASVKPGWPPTCAEH